MYQKAGSALPCVVGKRRLTYMAGFSLAQAPLHTPLLLVGGSKGTQAKDIRRAQQYWRDYLGEK